MKSIDVGDTLIEIERSNRSDEHLARVSGFGLNEKVSRADFDDVFRAIDAESVDLVHFYLAPGPQEIEILGWLRTAGFQSGTRFVRWLMPAADAPPPSPVHDIRLIGGDEGMAFAQIVAVNYHYKRGIDLSWLADQCVCPGFATFLGYVDGKPIATGRLHGAQNICVLGYGTTLRGYRGRGIQGAIIVARVRHAHSLGYEWATASTMGYDRSSRNLVRQGFRKAYEVVAYRR